jgi:prolyl 4-hydroxylase
MDESLLRHRSDGELPELTTKKSLGESLQLVHYDVTQEVRKGAMEKHVVLGSVGYAKLLILIFFLALFLMLQYTAHHDFGYARIDDSNQGARYSTLLFYLNDDMTGGQTSFPRWVNAESFEALKVKPEAGKAVLFYSQLPDGNLDDVSFI